MLIILHFVILLDSFNLVIMEVSTNALLWANSLASLESMPYRLIEVYTYLAEPIAARCGHCTQRHGTARCSIQIYTANYTDLMSNLCA